MEDKKVKFIQTLQMNVSDSVSYNLDTARDYLAEEGVDVDSFVKKGLAEISKTLKKKEQKKNKALFFKRVVLAAKIVNELHKELTFGHVKLQKLMYLCEEISNMEVSNRYVKQAAGPYDNRFMHSIDKELERLNWFRVEITNTKKGYKKYEYFPDEKLDVYKGYYERYYEKESDYIDWLINTFRSHPTSKVELVATIYYCLDEFKKNYECFSENELISRVFEWSIEKRKKFSEDQIITAYKWMLSKKLNPA